MIRVSTKLLTFVAAAVIGMASMVANAADVMKPFILASTGTGAVADKVEGVKKSLTDNGFTVAGDYSPYESAHIIVVTNDTLKKLAASHKRAGYASGQRVAITKVGEQVQVTYTNPAYMVAAYHVKGDISSVTKALAEALGSIEEFGSDDGMSADDIEGYHYAFGMEYFDEPSKLAEYGSYQEAVAAVEKGLTAKLGGAEKVYRIDVPGSKQTLFGVALSDEKTGNKYMDDGFIMNEIDFKAVRSTAHLPYDILVTGGEVEALHARFRIAINFPELSMMGDNSFMNIMATPDAINASLTEVSGGEVVSDW